MAGDGSTPIETAETLAKIIELRKRGWSFRRIAAAVGGRTKGSIRDEVRRYLANLAEQTAGMAGELRVLESERLDQYLLVIWEQIEQGHLGAIDRALKISARRAALWGLDAPTRQEHSGPDGGPIEVETAGEVLRGFYGTEGEISAAPAQKPEG